MECRVRKPWTCERDGGVRGAGGAKDGLRAGCDCLHNPVSGAHFQDNSMQVPSAQMLLLCLRLQSNSKRLVSIGHFLAGAGPEPPEKYAGLLEHRRRPASHLVTMSPASGLKRRETRICTGLGHRRNQVEDGTGRTW